MNKGMDVFYSSVSVRIPRTLIDELKQALDTNSSDSKMRTIEKKIGAYAVENIVRQETEWITVDKLIGDKDLQGLINYSHTMLEGFNRFRVFSAITELDK